MRTVITWALILLSLSLVRVPRANAEVQGSPPTLYQRFNKIFGSAHGTGNTLMIDSHGRCSNVNDTLLPSSEAVVSNIPQGAELLGAYLFWSGSLSSAGTDSTADFTVADGTTFQDVMADDCRSVSHLGGAFYCRKDVTSLVRSHPGAQSFNGMYVVGDVSAQPGICDPDGTCGTDPFCQARFAAWSIVLVWRDPLGVTSRDVILYDGFVNLDETATSPGILTFTIDGFQVANPPVAEITYFGLEGDASLGVPPQDTNPDPSIQCSTCFDYFAVNGTKLTDAFGWPNNVFNSSLANGVDIDRFNIGLGGANLLTPGDTSMTVQIGSGDGVVSGFPTPGGGGESVFVGWILLALDSLAPNFQRSRTFKSADPTSAAPGEVIQYQILVSNEGSLNATNVVVQDAIPANTTYVPGSTRVDNGAPLQDVAGTSPLVAGLNLGTIPFQGDNDRQITFRVRVNATVPQGTTEITNLATVRSTETMPRDLRAVTVLVNETAMLGQPTKSVVSLGGADVKPSDTLLYTVTIPNVGNRGATDVQYADDLPSWVRNFRITSVNAGPSATVSFAPPPAGSNARGRLTVSGISIPAGNAATIGFAVTVDSVAEFAAAGVPLHEIHGKEIINQGSVTAPFLTAALLTDDPNTSPVGDPTKVVLNYRPVLTTTKTVTDSNGSPTEPGDTLGYEIRISNSGNLQASVSLADDLPAGVGSFALSGCPSGATCSFANGRLTVTGLIVAPAGGSAVITFTVRVNDPIPNGTSVQNCATIAVIEAPAQNRTFCSSTLVVVATPLLGESTKTVVDDNGGDVEPGDALTYQLVVRNTGNQPASAVTVTDVIDTTNLEAIAPQDGGTFDGSTITWSPATTPALSSIAAGGQVTLRFKARIRAGVASGTVIANQGSLSSAEVPGPTLTDDPATAAIDDPTRVTVVTMPRFDTSTKTVSDENGGEVRPGDFLAYTIVVRNTGRGSASAVVVTDPIDTATLTEVAPGQGGRFDGAQIIWDATTTPVLATLAAGGQTTLNFRARVVSPLANGTVIANQGRVTSREVTSAQLTDDPATAAPSDPTRVTVVSSATLAGSTKTVVDQNGGVAQPGDALTYTITVRNGGDAPARSVVVTDPVPAGLENIVPGQGGRFDASGRTLTWDASTTAALARVVPGTDVVLTFTATIQSGLADGTVIANQASLVSSDLPSPALSDDPATPAPSDPTRLTVLSRPDFVTSTKTFTDDNGGDPRPGDTITWTLTVVNSGASAATGVSVSDVVDPRLTDISPGQGGRFDAATRTVTWDPSGTGALATLASGARTALTFTSRIVVPLDDGTVIANQGQVRSAEVTTPQPTDDPATPARGDPTQLTVRSAPDLTGSPKTVADPNGDPVKPGDTIRYTIAVTNRGTAVARDVVAVDVIDANLENVTPESGGTFDTATRTIRWTAATTPALATVSPGAGGRVELSFTATVRANLPNGTVIANQASLTATGISAPALSDDPRTAVPADPTRVVVVSGADLNATTKSVEDLNGGAVQPGDLLRYTLTIPNRGDGPATNVIVSDLVDQNLTEVRPGPGGTFNAATRTLTWQAPGVPALASLAAGAQVVVTFEARVATPLDNGTVISNQASITAQGLVTPVLSDDPATVALDDPTLVTVVSRVDLGASTKAVADENGGDVVPGDPLVYTITVVNSGDAPARNVVVNDPLHPSLARPPLVENGGRFENGLITWDASSTPALAVVNPGAPVVLRFRAGVVVPTANGTVIANQAAIAAQGIAPVRSDDPATPAADDPTLVTVRSAADLSGSTKAVTDINSGTVEPGDELSYVITVRNDGTDTATGVTVTDVVDANLTGVAVQDGGTFDAATRRITWSPATTASLASVAPRTQVLLRFNARVVSPLAGGVVIRNQATIASPSIPTPVPSDNPATPAVDDSTDVTVSASPVFSTTTKAVVDTNGGLVRPGDPLAYTIIVRNSGRAVANGVVVRDPIASTLTQVAAGQGGVFAGGEIRWDASTTPSLAQLAPGEQVTLGFQAIIAPGTANGTTIANQAQIVSAEVTTATGSDDPSTAALGDPTAITVAFPDLAGSTKDYLDENGGDPNPGDTVIYTVTVLNRGARAAQNVVVTDRIDPNLVEVQPGQGGTQSGDTVTWSPQTTPALATIAPGAQVALILRTKIRELLRGGVVIRNQAQITESNTTGVTPSDNPRTPNTVGDPTDITVVAAPILDQTFKSVVDENGGDVQPGDRLRYTIMVRNSGTTFAANVVVTDPVPAGLTQVAPGEGGLLQGGTITWNAQTTPALAQLNPGAEVSLSFTAVVDAQVADGMRIANQASVRADDLTTAVPSDDPATNELDDPTAVVVVANPRLGETTKAVRDDNGGNVEPGDTLTYTITVRNSGAREALATILSDPIPTGAAYVASSTRLNDAPVADAAGGLAPVAAGLVVSSPGAPAGTVRRGADAVVTYQLRVLPSALPGSLIRNQGVVTATDATPALTDDPATVEVDDATVVVVGVGTNLGSTQKTVRIAEDRGTPGVAEVDDVLEYVITVPNRGNQTATGVVFTDRVPARTELVAGSITFNGQALTDAQDADPGEVLPPSGGSNPEVRVRLGDLAAGRRATITFRVKVREGPLVSNQGEVRSTQGGLEHTDADGNDLNGDQPTVTPVGTAPVPSLDVTKDARDVDGGSVQPSDTIEYSFHVRNTGNVRLEDISFEDAIPARMTFVAASASQYPGSTVIFTPPPAGAHGRGLLRVTGLTLSAGRDLRFSFRAQVAANATCGTTIANTARFQASGVTPFDTNRKAFLVCGGVGSAAIQGVVFQDKGIKDGTLGGDDYRLADFQVLAYHAERGTSPVRTAISGSDGRFRLFDLPPGVYSLRVFSSQGVRFATVDNLRIEEGAALERNILIDPQGIAYDSVTGNPQGGVQALLYFDDTNAFRPGELVPPDFLGERQQGQRTNLQGMYQFDARPGHRYKLELVPSGQSLVFPSTLIPPTSGFAEVTPPDFTVVPNARPDRTGRTTYYLRFDLTGQANKVLHNHVPLDPVTSLIRIDKRANKRITSIGGIVSYTVRVQNLSARDFVDDAAKGQTQVFVRDLLPKGFKYRRGSTRVKLEALENGRRTETLVAGGDREPQGFAVGASGPGRLLRFGPYDLRAGQTIALRYQTVVGTQTPKGEHTNVAVVQAPGSVSLSNQAEAKVQVVADAIFDQGVVLGKVFCDRDANGKQNGDSERGVEGVRVYIDTGWYAETDRDGKYHLKDIDPGNHLIKVDADTLPPGSGFTTDQRRLIYVTRGLPFKIDFGIRCAVAKAGVQTVDVKRRAPGKPLHTRARVVRGNLRTLTLSVQGSPIPLGIVQLSAGQGRGHKTPLNARLGAKGRLSPPIRFLAKVGKTVKQRSWRIRVTDRRGRVVHEIPGSGSFPASSPVSWDGTDEAGQPVVVRGGRYHYQLLVETPAGTLLRSARHALGVEYGKRGARGIPHTRAQITVSGEIFQGRSTRATPQVLEKVDEIGAILKKDGALRLEIEVHSDERGGRLQNLLLSQRQAAALRTHLSGRHRIAPTRVKVRGLGASRPLMPNLNDRLRARNRRVVLRVLGPVRKLPDQPGKLEDPSSEPRVFVGEARVPFDPQGAFEHVALLGRGSTLLIEMVQPSGAGAVVFYREGSRAAPPIAEVVVEGNLRRGLLQLGRRRIAVPALAMALRADRKIAAIHGSGPLRRPVSLRLEGGEFPVRRWSLLVEPPGAGAHVAERGAPGFLPSRFVWKGSLGSGAKLSPGRVRIRIAAVDPRGLRYFSAPAAIEVSGPATAKASPPAGFKKTLRRAFGPARSERPTEKAKQTLWSWGARIRDALTRRPKASLQITVHTDPRDPAADLRLTRRQGAAIWQILLSRGVPPIAMVVDARGSREPVSKRPEGNRRVVLEVVDSKTAPAAASAREAFQAEARVGSERFSVGPSGGFRGKVRLRLGEPILIDLRTSTGARVVGIVAPEEAPRQEPPKGAPRAAGPAAVPSAKPFAGPNAKQIRPAGSKPKVAPPPRSPAPPAGSPKRSAAPPRAKKNDDVVGRWMKSAWDLSAFRVQTSSGKVLGGGETLMRGGGGSGMSPPAFGGAPPTPGAGSVPGGAPGSTAAKGPSSGSGARAAALAKKPPSPSAKSTAEARTGDAQAAAKSRAERPVPPPGSYQGFGEAEIADALRGKDPRRRPPVRAAQLEANLPPKGVVIKARSLLLTGRTHPENRLTVGGKRVRVAKDGRWRTRVRLKPGKGFLVLETRDKEGNVGRLRWPIEVSRWNLFVLALGDGAIGQIGAKIEGGDLGARKDIAGKLFLQGRTAIYVKGRIQGKWLFKNIRFTAHFDSARRKEMEQIFRQIIDTERFYPIYGDTAKEVKEINARDKLYVLVEADRSRLLVGNFKTQVKGVDLFSYDRAFYGLELNFDKAFAKGYGTKLKVFASRDGEIQQHAHVELRGTGGSIYYLRHRDILEGSEKVRVVVRDRDTGMELYSTFRSNFSDYTIDYPQGRILLKQPLPSIADASYLVNQNLSSQLNGHSVYLVIDYEYVGRANESGNALGFHLRQKIHDLVEVGGGYVREGRPGSDNPDYRLWGVHLKLQKDSYFFKSEFAQSKAVDAQSYVSDDGGLTFANLGNVWNRNRSASGNALKLEAGGDFAKTIGWGKGTSFKLRAYFQMIDPGFFSTGKQQDQGQARYGVHLTIRPSKKDEIVVRHDAFNAERFTLGDLQQRVHKSSRSVTTAQYTRREKSWSATAEYNHTTLRDDALTDTSHSDSVAGSFTYNVSKRVQILGRQEAFLRAGDRTTVSNGTVNPSPVTPTLGDQFATTLGARFALTEKTLLQITETLRWSGENATAIGLKTKLSDKINVYVQERLLQRDSRLMGTTVLGGENRLGKNSRAYAEYQLDAGMLGARNRAVLGAGHRFHLGKRFHLDVGYERSQTFGDSLGGDSSRDAISVGIEYLKKRWLKLGGRYEVRFDNGDPRVGGHDKLQVVTANTVTWSWSRDLSFLAKLNYSLTDNRSMGMTEAEMMQMSTGVAYRPRTWNWFNLLVKYTKYIDQRPLNLVGGTLDRVHSDIFTVIPIFELPYGFQFVEKVAFKREREAFSDLPLGVSDTLLWVTRLNYHLTRWADVSGEYRLLQSFAAADFEHGFLFEASLIVKRFLRFGVGYNFTRFGDDELVRNRIDQSGVFFRVVGMY